VKDQVLIVQEVGLAPRPVWTGVEYLAPNGIPSPDRPARSNSLYQLSYHGSLRLQKSFIFLDIYSDNMFYNNLSSDIQVVPRGRTDMMKKILAFHNSA